MFFGLMLVDAALAAWAVGILGQPGAPRWVRAVLVWIVATGVVSVGLVWWLGDHPASRSVGLIAPAGAVTAAIALLVATRLQRRAGKPG
jgi:hypothetical protein